jgi:AcrR family transcriptional regulator
MNRRKPRRPGRPREDRLLRQREIFLAVAPIILAEGARAVTMRRAAQAACLSVGGLYHYFPNRRALLLHGAQPEATIRLCHDFFDGQSPYGADQSSWAMAASFVEFQMEELRLIRPAVRAALELGVEEFDKIVAAGLRRGTQEFVDALRRVLPDAEQRDLEGLSRAVRRLELASVLDPDSTDDELRAALRGLLARSFRRPAGVSGAANGEVRRRDAVTGAAAGAGGRS